MFINDSASVIGCGSVTATVCAIIIYSVAVFRCMYIEKIMNTLIRYIVT